MKIFIFTVESEFILFLTRSTHIRRYTIDKTQIHITHQTGLQAKDINDMLYAVTPICQYNLIIISYCMGYYLYRILRVYEYYRNATGSMIGNNLNWPVGIFSCGCGDTV